MEPGASRTAIVSSRRQVQSLLHLLSVPNVLTLLRVLSVPVLVAMVSEHRLKAALYLFSAAALTDGLDGAVARWFSGRTAFGAFLDPFADKLLLLSSFVALTQYGIFPGWLLGVVILRDVIVVCGYFMISWLTEDRMLVLPSYLGKVGTFCQAVTVLAGLAGFGAYWPAEWRVLLYLTAGFTALSGLHYMYRGLLWLSAREPGIFA